VLWSVVVFFLTALHEMGVLRLVITVLGVHHRINAFRPSTRQTAVLL